MLDYPMPLERLKYFQEKVGLSPEELALVASHRHIFVERHQEFGAFFYEYFSRIPRTRLILEHDNPPRNLERVLGWWFARMFSEDFSPGFIQHLWDSGLRHVEVNLDQRYVNLGYTIARQFCHQVTVSQVDPAQAPALLAAIDKMLDFCVLVATDSLISVTERCDRQVIEGIAHQVRNPVMVIGGNIKRLQNQVPEDSPAFRAYQTVLQENMRLERMVRDIVVYNELFRGEPQPRAVDLAAILATVLERLAKTWPLERYQVRRALDPRLGLAQCDARDLETMLWYLLENCLEAVDPADPRLEITSRPSRLEGFLEVELFNTGKPPSEEELAGLFTPFNSSKPQGTGFGLPIASLAARRNQGFLSLAGGLNGGTLSLIRLPLAPAGPGN
ncbi:MAG: protoglobin domain-containing protein [Pseudomonadota bacterium]